MGSASVPGPFRQSAGPLAAVSGVMMFGSAASAASVEQAAKKLADVSYPMVKATDWATTDVLDKYVASVPTTKEFSKAILELSVSLDPKLVKDAVQAHKKAVEAMGPNFVTPLKNHEEVTTALAKMFAAAPADKIKAVFDAYPLIKSTDWANTGVLDSYVAKTPATKESILALLNAGLAMDPKVIQAAVQAHLDAINDVDGSLVTSMKGHEEVTVAVAKLIASAPPAVIKSVFDTVPQVQSLNGDWFASMPLADAVKSYQAFLETAAAVKR